jgi:hypothetical protein
VVSQGAKDVRTDLWAHLRYTAPGPESGVRRHRFHAIGVEAAPITVRLYSPDAPILFEMLSVGAIGRLKLPDLGVK